MTRAIWGARRDNVGDRGVIALLLGQIWMNRPFATYCAQGHILAFLLSVLPRQINTLPSTSTDLTEEVLRPYLTVAPCTDY